METPSSSTMSAAPHSNLPPVRTRSPAAVGNEVSANNPLAKDPPLGETPTTHVFAGTAMEKVSQRVIPVVALAVFLNFLDRCNLSFAALQMNRDLGFSPETYGIGSGLFFLGYAVFQIPSNLILRKVGAPLWLSFILVSWGALATGNALITTRTSFFVMRLCLGLVEAGFIPGVWYYITRFFPEHKATMVFAMIEVAGLGSHALGAPIAACVLLMNGWLGIRGWQWLFITLGIPTMLLGAVLQFLLPSSVEACGFLTSTEKRALQTTLRCQARKQASAAGVTGAPPTEAMTPLQLLWIAAQNRYVWCLGLLRGLVHMSSSTLAMWSPIMLHALITRHELGFYGNALGPAAPADRREDRSSVWKGGEDNDLAGAHNVDMSVFAVLLLGLPFSMSAVWSVWLGHSSSQSKERFYHSALPYMLAGGLFLLFAPLAVAHPLLGFFSLTAGILGSMGSNSPVISLVNSHAAGPALVVALPLFNTLVNLVGFVGPALTGALLQRYHGFGFACLTLGGLMVVAGLALLALRWHVRRQGSDQSQGAAEYGTTPTAITMRNPLLDAMGSPGAGMPMPPANVGCH